MRTFIAVSLIQLALFPQASHGYISTSDGLLCDTIMPKNASSFEVCSIAFFEGPSIVSVEVNDSVSYEGDYINDYLIYRSFPDAAGTSQSDVAIEYNAGYQIRVERNQTSDECMGVWVNRQNCLSCTFCGNETYSADCTNLQFGRQATCENATQVFFPLTADALQVVEPPVVDMMIKNSTSGGSNNNSAGGGGKNSTGVGSNGSTSSTINHHHNAGRFMVATLLLVPVLSIMS